MAWCPYALLAALAGIFNVWNAWQQLTHDCRFLVFFRPLRTAGFYVWLAAQMAVPALTCWLCLGLQNKPELNLGIIGKAIVVGIGFVAIMNTTTEIVGVSFDIRAAYQFVVRVAYNLIASRETARTAQFWQTCKEELQSSRTITEGLKYLREYVQLDVSRTTEEKATVLKAIGAVEAEPDPAKRADALQAAMTVRRGDLPLVLRKFGCQNSLASLGAR